MSGSLNRVQLIGHLGADPEMRQTQDGRPIARMRIATSDRWRDKETGERRERTEWHTVIVFNENLCKLAEQYLKKGSKVYIEVQPGEFMRGAPAGGGGQYADDEIPF